MTAAAAAAAATVVLDAALGAAAASTRTATQGNTTITRTLDGLLGCLEAQADVLVPALSTLARDLAHGLLEPARRRGGVISRLQQLNAGIQRYGAYSRRLDETNGGTPPHQQHRADGVPAALAPDVDAQLLLICALRLRGKKRAACERRRHALREPPGDCRCYAHLLRHLGDAGDCRAIATDVMHAERGRELRRSALWLSRSAGH